MRGDGERGRDCLIVPSAFERVRDATNQRTDRETGVQKSKGNSLGVRFCTLVTRRFNSCARASLDSCVGFGPRNRPFPQASSTGSSGLELNQLRACKNTPLTIADYLLPASKQLCEASLLSRKQCGAPATAGETAFTCRDVYVDKRRN